MIGSVRRLGTVAGLMGLAFWQGTVAAQEAAPEPKPQYVGLPGCKMCHKSAKKGDQYGKWTEGRHSKAYATLASEEAKAIAAKQGIADPQKDGKCLKCHVTAYGVDASLIAEPKPGKKGHQIEDGVACESCHGPGSLYKKRSVMKDREASVAAGLIIPDEKACAECHNDESPTFKPFNYAERLKAIAHPNPLKAAAEEGSAQ